jgi:putative transposase
VERCEVLDVLHEVRFIDKSPAAVYAALLDEGRYLCSIRTMYRILHSVSEVRERRRQANRTEYLKPELLATGPNEVWSWDITKLKGPEKWTYFYAYVMIDIYSRCVVGWLVATRESAELGKTLVEESCDRQKVSFADLTVHSDRGSPMTAKSMALLLSDLGLTQSLSRPHVSDDNPFSESHFKTMKSHPAFPDRFGSIEDARAFLRSFFRWYNEEHYHSGIALMTPNTVHYGRGAECNAFRQQVLDEAYLRNPARFVRKAPLVTPLPEGVWINPPKPLIDATEYSISILNSDR